MNNEAGRGQEGEIGGRFLCFSLAGQKYAIPLLLVKEVIGQIETTPIPQSPAHFKGIMNLRGQVISVIDLRQKLKLQTSQTSPEQSIIIVDFQSLFLGFIVDSVDRVAMWDESKLSGPPDTQGSTTSAFVTGVAKESGSMVLILDLAAALSVEDFKAAKSQLKNVA